MGYSDPKRHGEGLDRQRVKPEEEGRHLSFTVGGRNNGYTPDKSK
jgi:hypothetical protein